MHVNTMNYDFQEIEKKWQKYWAENGTFKLGPETFQLTEIRKIERKGDNHIVTTTQGKKVFGKLTGWNTVKLSKPIGKQAAAADQIDIHAVVEQRELER